MAKEKNFLSFTCLVIILSQGHVARGFFLVLFLSLFFWGFFKEGRPPWRLTYCYHCANKRSQIVSFVHPRETFGRFDWVWQAATRRLKLYGIIGGFRGGAAGAAPPPFFFLSCIFKMFLHDPNPSNLPLSVVIIIQSGFNFILFRSFPYLNISCVNNYDILSSIEYIERLQLKPLP